MVFVCIVKERQQKECAHYYYYYYNYYYYYSSKEQITGSLGHTLCNAPFSSALGASRFFLLACFLACLIDWRGEERKSKNLAQTPSPSFAHIPLSRYTTRHSAKISTFDLCQRLCRLCLLFSSLLVISSPFATSYRPFLPPFLFLFFILFNQLSFISSILCSLLLAPFLLTSIFPPLQSICICMCISQYSPYSPPHPLLSLPNCLVYHSIYKEEEKISTSTPTLVHSSILHTRTLFLRGPSRPQLHNVSISTTHFCCVLLPNTNHHHPSTINIHRLLFFLFLLPVHSKPSSSFSPLRPFHSIIPTTKQQEDANQNAVITSLPFVV
ncbi:MAG: hypothetical protein J3R72DRAFT_68995 [Linnemannia gamsii]|nr:MAG: hypothetical protein J3R72DRAFT_68995 [Linnemannia gamsii]